MVHSMEAFLDAQVLRVWTADIIQPSSFIQPDCFNNERGIVQPFAGGITVPTRFNNLWKIPPVRPYTAPYLIIFIDDQRLLGTLHDLQRAEVMQVHSREADRIAHLKRIIHLRHGRSSEPISKLVGFPCLLAEGRERYRVFPVRWIVIRALRLYAISPSLCGFPSPGDVVYRSGSRVRTLRRFGHHLPPTIDMHFQIVGIDRGLLVFCPSCLRCGSSLSMRQRRPYQSCKYRDGGSEAS